MSGVGRADIYKPSTGEIWEIKHGGSSADMQAQRVREAHDQVKRYRDKYTEVSLQLGAAGAFAGAFTINYLNTTYLVTYDTPKEGVILYYLTRASDYDPNPFAIRKPALAPAGNNQQQMIGLVLTGFVYCAVGCAANNAKRHCFISN